MLVGKFDLTSRLQSICLHSYGVFDLSACPYGIYLRTLCIKSMSPSWRLINMVCSTAKWWISHDVLIYHLRHETEISGGIWSAFTYNYHCSLFKNLWNCQIAGTCVSVFLFCLANLHYRTHLDFSATVTSSQQRLYRALTNSTPASHHCWKVDAWQGFRYSYRHLQRTWMRQDWSGIKDIILVASWWRSSKDKLQIFVLACGILSQMRAVFSA